MQSIWQEEEEEEDLLLTCARWPRPSSAGRWGWTAGPTRWLAGTRSSCESDTPVETEKSLEFLRPTSRARQIYFLFSSSPANLSNVDPALDDSRPHVRPELPVLQHGADHAGRHGVELRDGGADGGGTVLVVLLVPLGPDGAQAVVRHHLLEQQLQRKREEKTNKKQADVSLTDDTGDLLTSCSAPPPALSAPV